ncbi:uncharacterized protein LOC129005968 isoform X2 [Macrosteles quadrilineatus]|uniref:uncharacterized protein LOC129005968 isoform X2 n=1 Tax=Macrosteles quadrilineatus TaxID=74068 RepID=UPI0023E1E8F2|nr:uncharacterized protein LOC129005968 isoform X2 [Macrosteles quadrilineatus]
MKLSSWSVVLFITIPPLFIAQTNGDFPSGAHQAVRCMLAYKSHENCASLPKVIVPSYLLQEYNDSPSSLQEALMKTTLNRLPESLVSNIPTSLLYLIPRVRLADLTINQLIAILQTHADDKSLVHQVATCLQHDNNMVKFIEKINGSIPEEALQILAESMEITDLTEDFLKLPFIENKPLLAYLRPAVLLNVETTTLYSIYNVLRMAESKPPKKPAFYFLTEAAIKHRAPLSKLKGFVLGLNPDQLLNENISFDVSVTDFRLDLSLLQARALFERSYQNLTLSSSNFIDSKPLLYKLSPELLQKFPQNVQKYEVNFIEKIATIPLPTACQITEYVKADCISTRRLPKEEDEFWDTNIKHMGKWVYTLPLSSLEGYRTNPLNTANLKRLESPAISPMQAYYLTGRGEALDVTAPNSISDLESFLQALPASQLVNRKLGEISSTVKLHLVSKLPENNLARTLSLVNKISSSIGDPVDETGGDSSVLEELLGNSDVNQIMSLLSPKDLALSAEAILKFFADKKRQSLYGEVLVQLPQQILTALLEHQMAQSSQWRWSNLLDHSKVGNLLVGGLTCQHIQDMDTGLFIPIMARYNTIRKKQFPKNLQHCCLQKLINHLKLKMTLSQTDSESGLISLLEPIEIESIGGFVLVDIPLEAMKVSPYLGHILSTIGHLSTTELMLSTDITRLTQIAQLAIEKDGNVNTFVLRNLVWFLPATANTPDLRLMLEAQLIDSTVCLPAEQRNIVAAKLISAFGSPEQWSAGVLATLQDLLVVFNDEELNRIPQSSWTKAADSLVSHYNDLVDWVNPSTFYKVCASILGELEENEYKSALSRYTRKHLTAAQRLLDSVVSLPQSADIKQNYKYTPENLLSRDDGSKVILTVFNPQMETEFTDGDDESEVNDINRESSTSETSTSEESTSTTETSTTETSTTETSTPETSTTEQRTPEINTTDKSTTGTSITEKSTTETITLEQSTIVQISSVQSTNTTHKSTTGTVITEKSRPTTETITLEQSTTVQISSAQSTAAKSVSQQSNLPEKYSEDESKTKDISSEISRTAEKSSTEKSLPDTHTDIETKNDTQEKFSTKIILEENFTEETSMTLKIGESNESVSNTTMGVPVPINRTTPSVSNTNVFKRNYTTKPSVILHSNANNTNYAPLCTNSVNKDECQNKSSNSNSTEIETFIIKTTTESFTNAQNKTYKPEININSTSSNNSDTQTFSKTEYLISDKFNSSSSQNASFIPGKMHIDQVKHQIAVNTSFEEAKFSSKTQNNTVYKYNLINNSTPPSNKSSSESTLRPKIYHITEEKYHSNVPGEHHKNKEFEDDKEEEEEEEIVEDSSSQHGILVNPNNARKKKRSIFFHSKETKLSCNAIKMVGSLAELTLTAADFNEMLASEMADCRVEFGAMELSEAIQKIIWKRMDNDLKLDGIYLLGKLLRVVTVADLWDIDFRASKPWVLETIHAIIQHNNNTMLFMLMLLTGQWRLLDARSSYCVLYSLLMVSESDARLLPLSHSHKTTH